MSGFNKSSFFVVALICLTWTMTAQSISDFIPKRPLNIFCMGVGGGATYISFEYERIFGRGRLFFVSAGAGLGAATEPESETDYTTLPFHVTGNIGRGASFFEYGAGRTLIFDHPSRNGISYLILGYRLALPKKHRFSFSLRFNLDIPFNYWNVVGEGDPQFIPAGLGLGIGF